MTEQPKKALSEVRITKADVMQNSAQALLKGIPYIGETLSQFCFGLQAELRMKRAEKTLIEIGEAIHKGKIKSYVDTEQFTSLLEKTIPQISRAVSEDRRVFLRNLLVNAAHVEPNKPEWSNANLTAELISEIDAPGLAVLAAFGNCKSARCFISSQPTPRIHDDDTGFPTPTGEPHQINFEWPVVEEWVLRLREKRLIGFGSGDARGGFGGAYLTELGKMVIGWSKQSSPKS